MIVDRALAAAERSAADGLELRYRWRHTNTTTKPSDDGSATRSEYQVYPVAGEPFYELVEIDGQAATGNDLQREAKMREKFRDRVGGRSGIAFDRSLVARYKLSLEGRRLLNGRLSWVIAFAPLDDPPPVERSVDYALNHCSGRFWIDVEDSGLARIDFSLREKVRVWAGVLGAVDVFEGSFVQQRVEPGGWLPASMDLSMDGRALFSSLEQTVSLEWSDYRPIPEAADSGSMMKSKEGARRQ